MSFVAIAGLIGVVVAAGLAWACTAQARINLSHSSGVPRTHVVVTGTEWNAAPGAAPVEIRWNSPTGELLARSPRPQDLAKDTGAFDFTVEIVIPEASPGVYYVVATQSPMRVTPGHEKQQNAIQRAPFEVLATGEAPAERYGAGDEELTGSGTSGSAYGGDEQRRAAGRGGTHRSASGGSAPGEIQDQAVTGEVDGGQASAGRLAGKVSGTGRGGPGAPSDGRNTAQSAPASDARRLVPVAPAPQSVPNSSGALVFRGSLSDPGANLAAGVAGEPGSNVPAVPATLDPRSDRSVMSDLFSGFAPAGPNSLVDAVPDGAASRNQLMVGALLLGLGLTTLAGGSAVTLVRQRRRTARYR